MTMNDIFKFKFDGFLELTESSGGLFRVGVAGVERICTPKDRKV